MNSKGKLGMLATATALVGALSGFGSQAKADTVPITFSTVSGGTDRALNLYSADGTQPAAVNLSSGNGGFIADVTDTGIDPAVLGKFDVEATMSNLYKTTSTGFDCTAPSIPSSAVSLSSLPSLLDAHGLNAVLQPILSLSGDLSVLNGTSVLSGLGVTLPSGTTTISGVTSQLSNTVSQSLMAGSSLSDLTGSVLSNGSLPFDLSSTSGTASPFALPDPTNDPCKVSSSSTPTQLQVLHGALNTLPGPLQGEVQTVLEQAFNSSTPAAPTLTWLTQNPSPTSPYILPSVAQSLIVTALQGTGVTSTLLNLNPSLLSAIEDHLTATVTGVLSEATQLTGTYGADPALTISAPSAAPGSYEGVLTVTLTSN